MAVNLLRRSRQPLDDHPDHDLGHLAAAMGLTVVAGDPSVNVAVDLPARFHDVAGGARSARRTDRQLDLRATGVVDGRTVDLAWSDAAGKRWGIITSTITYAFSGHLAVEARSALAPFELTTRTRSQSGFDPRPVFDGPEVPLGVPELDATHRLTAVPDLSPDLVRWLVHLAGHDGVHVVWDGTTVSHRLHPYCADLFADPAALLDGLMAMAEILEAEYPMP